uniref:MHC class I-like antigen recognition-like domain-containing protein n=1 Tax=Laticauda laticaudata TaxID=8630 RepID=A0A8C5S6I8_LATLA
LYSCELAEYGSERGYDLYAYDGKNFLSLNKATLNWTAANAEAEMTKKKWDADLDRGWRKKIYLEGECFALLKKWLDYAKKLRQGRVRMATLNKRRGTEADEVWLEDTFQGSVVPDSDGTYYYWLSIQIDPKERSCYRCHVEHDGLQEPLDLAMEEGYGLPTARILIGGHVGCRILRVGPQIGNCQCWKTGGFMASKISTQNLEK